ncbi:hypothetical protein AMJ47_00660 [Parcubacteria bacterium DG_72]|nr:MAG: hypothetical protein AMJ47_00660 [Parcubacteria bacterium DG_72]
MHRFCKLIYKNGDCDECGGTKKCQDCGGTGKHPDLNMKKRGYKCPSCKGTGECFYSPSFQKAIAK